MDLCELFTADDLVVGFDPTDKWDGIERLVDCLVETGKLDAGVSQKVLEQVLARERSMSTGMEHGIAIPHAAVDQTDHVLACMGIVSRQGGLAFDSIDAQPARVIVLLVIPRSQKLLHIRTLADVARVLQTDSVRDALIGADSPARAWDALSAGGAASPK